MDVGAPSNLERLRELYGDAAAMRAWLEGAGLEPRRPRWLRTLPGAAQVVGVKPA